MPKTPAIEGLHCMKAREIQKIRHPNLSTRVHDAFMAGEGILHTTLFGVVSLVMPEIAQGEIMRFLAEAAWYPTALLPNQGVQWKAKDGFSAKATLKNG